MYSIFRALKLLIRCFGFL